MGKEVWWYRVHMIRRTAGVILRSVPSVVFIAAVLLFLITASVTLAVNELRLYSYGFDKRDIHVMTGIEVEELMSIAHQIRGYFNSTGEPLEIRATVFSKEQDLFNEREIIHMKDVKRLIWGVYLLGALSLGYILSSISAGFRIHGRSYAYLMARNLLWGSGITLGTVLVVGLIASIGFDGLFTLFHEISFSNDFWKLNPGTDYLVMLFPAGFWFDATMFVGIVSVIGAIAIGSTAGGFLYGRRMKEVRRSFADGRTPHAHA